MEGYLTQAGEMADGVKSVVHNFVKSKIEEVKESYIGGFQEKWDELEGSGEDDEAILAVQANAAGLEALKLKLKNEVKAAKHQIGDSKSDVAQFDAKKFAKDNTKAEVEKAKEELKVALEGKVTETKELITDWVKEHVHSLIEEKASKLVDGQSEAEYLMSKLKERLIVSSDVAVEFAVDFCVDKLIGFVKNPRKAADELKRGAVASKQDLVQGAKDFDAKVLVKEKVERARDKVAAATDEAIEAIFAEGEGE